MIEFKDRDVANKYSRLLEVKSIVKDYNGEIKELVVDVVRHFISTALVKLFRQITHIISTHHIILSKEKELDDTLKFLI